MRIIHINTINQVAYLHAQGLKPLGYESTVYHPSDIGGFAPLPAKLALMPWRMFDMLRLTTHLNPREYDLAHINWASYGAMGLLGRIPYVVEAHGTDVIGRMSSRVHRPLLDQIFRHAGAVLCITPDLLELVRPARPDTVYVPGPIDTDKFVPGPGAPGRPWTIFLFARLEPRKRVDIAVAGIERFMRRHQDVHVRMVDWGVWRDEYRERYTELFGERFEMMPRMAPTEIQRLIHEANVVVGQFGAGAMGLSELQSMSSRAPVIMSFRYPSAYRNQPPILNAATPAEIDEHLEHVYTDPQYGVQVGYAAREWVVANHSLPAVAARLDAIYRRVVRA